MVEIAMLHELDQREAMERLQESGATGNKDVLEMLKDMGCDWDNEAHAIEGWHLSGKC